MELWRFNLIVSRDSYRPIVDSSSIQDSLTIRMLIIYNSTKNEVRGVGFSSLQSGKRPLALVDFRWNLGAVSSVG